MPGYESKPPLGPDGFPFPIVMDVWWWSEPDRERGSYRKAGPTNYSSAVAVVGASGNDLSAEIADYLSNIPLEVESESLDGPEIQEVRVVGAPDSGLFVSDQVRVDYGATSGALDANDAYGELMKVAVPLRGRILSIKVVDQDDVIAAGTLAIWVFNSAMASAPVSDAAIASGYTANDLAHTVTIQAFGCMTDMGAARFLEVVDIDSEYYAPDGYLRFQLSTSGTPTPSRGGMPLVQFNILQL